MKKFLSVLLALFVAIAFIGTHSLITVNAEEGDKTLYIHVFQFDGDYTNTGVGIWDSSLEVWSGWDTNGSTSTDDFGAVIPFTITAATIANASYDPSNLQFEVVKDRTLVDATTTYVAGGDGKVYYDLSSFVASTDTELHIYLVEGDTEFMTLDSPMGTVVIYMDPAITIDATTYDGWGIHSWNNGTMADTDWSDPMAFTNTLDVTAGEYTIPMETVIVPLDSDAVNTSGFIVHSGDSKADPDDLALDVPTNGPVNIEFYIRGTGTIYTDAATFLADAETEYQAGLVNRFMSAEISDPETVAIEMFQPKTPYNIAASMWVESADGTTLDIVGYDFGDTIALGTYESAVTIQSQTHVKFYLLLPTGSDVTNPLVTYGLVGDLTGWAPDQTTIAPTEYINVGTEDWLVFEFATYQSSIAFKVLYDAAGAFDWSDAQVASVAGDNVSIDFAGASSVTYRFDSTTEVLTPDMYSVPSVSYTYTPVASQTDNLLTIFLPLDPTKLEVGDTYDLTNVVIVGSFTDHSWAPDNSFAPTEIITVGADEIAVFQIDTPDASGEYKALYAGTDDVFAWGDTELITTNTAFNFAGGTTLIHDLYDTSVHDALVAYVDTVTVENTFLLTVYMEDNYEGYSVGIVGALNGWDIANPILPTTTDVFGNLVFDIAVTSRTGEYKIFIDKNEDGFDWGDAVTGPDNLSYDLGTANQGVLYFSEGEDNVFVKEVIGETIDVITTKTASLLFATDTFLYTTGEYTVYFTETEASEGVDELVIESALTYATDNAYVVPSEDSDFDATYALNATEIIVQLESAVTAIDGFAVVDQDGVSVGVTSIDKIYEMGTFTSTVTAGAGEQVVTVYLHTTRDYTDITQFGIVGDPQGWDGTDYQPWPTAWDTANVISPVGVDSNGNIVFQFVVGTTEDTKSFKIIYDPEGDGFAWDGNEETPDNVEIVPNQDITLFFETGSSVDGATKFFDVTLASALNKYSTYSTVLVDSKGFVVYNDLYVDNEAPDPYFTVKQGATFTVEQDATFDIMDYYTIFDFVDARNGNVDYEVVQDIDTSVVGVQQFIVRAQDVYGNVTRVIIPITVVDVTAPVLTVSGDLTFTAGDAEPDWASYATTNEGTITVDASGVDMTKAGSYYVRWTATDASGNSSTERLIVTIEAAPVEETGTAAWVYIVISSSVVVAGGGAALFIFRKRIFK